MMKNLSDDDNFKDEPESYSQNRIDIS